LAGTALACNGSANAGELFQNAPSDEMEGKSLSSVAGGSLGRGPFRALVDTVSDTLYDQVARKKPSYAGGGKTSAELKTSPEGRGRRVVVYGGGEESESWDEALHKEEKAEALTNSHEALALSQMTSSTKKAIVLDPRSKSTLKRRSAQGYVCDE